MQLKSNDIFFFLAGWLYENGRKGLFYGFGVPADYSGEIPEGFEYRDFPEWTYLVFFHPAFDYLADNGEVMSRVENFAWSFVPENGYKWRIPI